MPSEQTNLVVVQFMLELYTGLSYIHVMSLTGADPGFGIRGGVSRRGVWGPLKVPQRFQDRALVGGPGGYPP
jgi:hypothetical protein